MPVRSLITAHECVEQYEISAGEWYDLGLDALARGMARGIECIGLGAEMLLKAAYFRFDGFATTTQIRRADLDNVVSDVSRLGVTISHESFHNLNFWAEAVIAARRHGLPARIRSGGVAQPAVAANPMSAQDESDLRSGAQRLMSNYTVTQRYVSTQGAATLHDIEDVFDDGALIKTLYDAGKI